MFRPHYGNCINGHEGFIVVKAGYCDRCNYRQKQEKKQGREVKPGHKTMKALIDLYDTLFSILRRKMAADEDGNCICCTCNKTFPWKEIQCGHFITRGVYFLRWNTMNTAPQCGGKNCNAHPTGNQDLFVIYLDKAYGIGTAEELKIERHKGFKLDRQWLIEEIGNCKKKLLLLKHIV